VLFDLSHSQGQKCGVQDVHSALSLSYLAVRLPGLQSERSRLGGTLVTVFSIKFDPEYRNEKQHSQSDDLVVPSSIHLAQA
jgi:hypothetical protein